MFGIDCPSLFKLLSTIDVLTELYLQCGTSVSCGDTATPEISSSGQAVCVVGHGYFQLNKGCEKPLLQGKKKKKKSVFLSYCPYWEIKEKAVVYVSILVYEHVYTYILHFVES